MMHSVIFQHRGPIESRTKHSEAENEKDDTFPYRLLETCKAVRWSGMQQELPLRLTLGAALIPVKGWAAPEVERAFSRARELCEGLGDPPELFFVLFGMWTMHFIRGELRTAFELA